MVKLTPKQDAFVKAYLLNNGNATQAAIDAGYSKKTAQQVGSENLLKPVIRDALHEHQKKSDESYVKSKADKLKILDELIDACKVKDAKKGVLNAPAVISAIKEHNLMMGDNAPTETNSTLNIVTSDDEQW